LQQQWRPILERACTAAAGQRNCNQEVSTIHTQTAQPYCLISHLIPYLFIQVFRHWAVLALLAMLLLLLANDRNGSNRCQLQLQRLWDPSDVSSKCRVSAYSNSDK
jgi:hypothetical protein